jgi:hypothetical protein
MTPRAWGGKAVCLIALLAALVAAGACGRTAPSAKSGPGARTHPTTETTTTAAPVTGAGARFKHPELVTEVLSAAEDDAAIVGSYDYRDMPASLLDGLHVGTPAFRGSYQRGMTSLQAAAKTNETVQTVTVVRGGVGGFGAGEKRATVLLVIKQVIAKGANDIAPQIDFVTLTLTMQRSGDQGLADDLKPHGSLGVPPGTPDLNRAVAAARAEVLNTLTYTRTNFGAEFARTLEGLTGGLRTSVNTRQAVILQGMVKGKYDLRGQLEGVAVESATGRTVVVLIVAKEYKIANDLTKKLSSTGRLEVTMTQVGSKWLVSQIDAVGAS